MNRTYTLFFLLLFAAVNVQFNQIQSQQVPNRMLAGVQQKWVDDFTWVQSGNMPLVISVPHGGGIAPTALLLEHAQELLLLLILIPSNWPKPLIVFSWPIMECIPRL